MKQLTKEQAIAFGKNRLYEGMSYRQIAEFQLNQKRVCMPVDVFLDALEKSLGRPVFTHELGLNYEGLIKEFYGEKPRPTLDEILDLIPKERRGVIVITNDNEDKNDNE